MKLSLDLQKYKTYDILVPSFDEYVESTDDFLSEDHFIESLKQILTIMAQSDLSSVCLYDIQTILEFFVQIDLTTFTIKFSNDLIKHVNDCYSTTRFIVLPIKISHVNSKQSYSIEPFDFLNTHEEVNLSTAHSNLIIIDTHLHTIEYFEPHGLVMMSVMGGLLNIDVYLEFCIKTTFPFTFYYNFINTAQSCIVGPQLLQNMIDPAGHCLAWSLYFITLRLINYHLQPKEKSTLELLNEYITTFNSLELNRLIRKFITFAKQTLSFSPYTRYISYSLNHMLTQVDSNRVEQRIKYLCKTLLEMSQNFASNDMPLLFEELVTFRKHPDFFKIYSQTFR